MLFCFSCVSHPSIVGCSCPPSTALCFASPDRAYVASSSRPELIACLDACSSFTYSSSIKVAFPLPSLPSFPLLLCALSVTYQIHSLCAWSFVRPHFAFFLTLSIPSHIRHFLQRSDPGAGYRTEDPHWPCSIPASLSHPAASTREQQQQHQCKKLLHRKLPSLVELSFNPSRYRPSSTPSTFFHDPTLAKEDSS